ncbi:hypothetical protein DM02DRAFT_707333 [Periconia macrospinosa]|uniref:Rhodopsin domain-containing protein n=1 Tax=Periconia macrospinosa TaxID=97972 RepID=A0A2V1DSA4_9PLEO|nr:hypothetical protein DM02DRAFT_707333 [Periconia macrospinosa]
MRKVSWDDATLCLAMLGSVTFYVVCTYWVKQGGIGRHQWDISEAQLSRKELLVSSWLIAGLTPLTFLFLKTSFFVQYLSLFEQLRWATVCSWIGLVLTALAYSVQTILVFALPTPKKGDQWAARIDNIMGLSIPQSTIGLAVDLYILYIPIMSVYGLNLSWKRRIGVMLVFLSGIM